jgi:CubicO group peptidase (beta-lactamase class C family)
MDVTSRAFDFRLKIPSLEVREYSGDAARWLRQRVIYEPETMAFRWTTTRTDIKAATYRVRLGSLTGSIVFSGSGGPPPTADRQGRFDVNFERILPTPAPSTPRRYWVQLELSLAGGTAISSTAVEIVYQRDTSMPTIFTPGGLGEPIDPLVESVLAKHGLPAMGGVVVNANGTMQVSARGIRRHGYSRTVSETDRWHLGSDTKAMTATLAAILVDRGVIAWNSELADVLPELRDHMNPAFRTATLLDLLHHRSGLGGGRYSSTDSQLLEREGQTNDARRYHYAKAHLANAPLHPPGRWVYSNCGYIIAAVMMERCAKQSWEEMMKSLLFKPLRMLTTGFGAPETAITGTGPTQPWGHRGFGTGRQPSSADNPSAAGPAGNVHASLRDWAQFMLLQLNGHEEGVQISTSSLAQLHTPKIDYHPDDPGVMTRAYACGWGAGFNVTKSRLGSKSSLNGTYAHDGCNTWWYARAVMDKINGYAVLVATNIGGEDCDDARVLDAVDELTSMLVAYRTG